MRRQRFFSSTKSTLLMSGGVAALCDILFYGQILGWSLGLLVAVLALLLFVKRQHRRPMPQRTAELLLIGLIVSLFIEPGALNIVLSALMLLVYAVSLRGWRLLPVEHTARLAAAYARSVIGRIPADLPLLRRMRRRARTEAPLFLRLTALWGIPLIGSAVFLALFSRANPILEQAISEAAHFVLDFLSRLDFARIMLWVSAACFTWGMLRARPRRTSERSLWNGAETPKAANPGMVVRALVLFNVIFGVQTALDCIYLWAGRELPRHMTYAQYAHRGAYPLVITALLAGAFVLLTFSDQSKTQDLRPARALVLVWIAQNILLLCSTAWRLYLYIGAYLLTSLRMATIIWIGLVICGFVLVTVRIMSRRSNSWLLNANAFAAGAVLYVCCFVNFGGIIADYNVGHCRELTGSGPVLDLQYVYQLGPAALPAMDLLLREDNRLTAGERFKAEVHLFRSRMYKKLELQLAQWPSWTLRRWLVYLKSSR